MSKVKTKGELTKHKNKAIRKLDQLVQGFIDSSNPADHGRADKLSYWFEDYARLLKREKTFDPSKYIKYKKGDIVKMHLGYRLGSEQGGLHFAVVLDVNNTKGSDTVTVIPLSSVKSGKKLHKSSVLLGDELFKSVISKHDKLADKVSEKLKSLRSELESLEALPDDAISERTEKIEHLDQEIKNFDKISDELDEIRKSVIKMKAGSVALVGQITTISKIRIYDPVYSGNVLYGIRLSAPTMQLIDNKVAELFLSNYKASSPGLEK